MKIQNIQNFKKSNLKNKKIKMGDWEKKNKKLKFFDFLHSSKIKKNKMFYNLFSKPKFNFHFFLKWNNIFSE
jgi:hypothetical protein